MFVELTNVAAPFTVKLPVTVTSLLNVELPVTLIPPAAIVTPDEAPAPICTCVPVSVMFEFANPVPVHFGTKFVDKAAAPEIAVVTGVEPLNEVPINPVPNVKAFVKVPADGANDAVKAYDAEVAFNAYEAEFTDIEPVWFDVITLDPFTANDPVTKTDPVN